MADLQACRHIGAPALFSAGFSCHLIKKVLKFNFGLLEPGGVHVARLLAMTSRFICWDCIPDEAEYRARNIN